MHGQTVTRRGKTSKDTEQGDVPPFKYTEREYQHAAATSDLLYRTIGCRTQLLARLRSQDGWRYNDDGMVYEDNISIARRSVRTTHSPSYNEATAKSTNEDSDSTSDEDVRA